MKNTITLLVATAAILLTSNAFAQDGFSNPTLVKTSSVKQDYNRLQKKHARKILKTKKTREANQKWCQNSKKIFFKNSILKSLKNKAFKTKKLGSSFSRLKPLPFIDYDKPEIVSRSYKTGGQEAMYHYAEIFVEFEKQGVCRVLLKGREYTSRKKGLIFEVSGYAYCQSGNYYLIDSKRAPQRCQPRK